MAGAGLIDLKRRIKSVMSTQKITKAMGLVATVKFKTARMGLERYKAYYERLNESVGEIMSKPVQHGLRYEAVNIAQDDLYIVITSDSGLCGSYNGNVINTVVNRVKGRENENQFITVGQKGKSYFETRGYRVIEAFTGVSLNPDYREISRIIKPGVDLFLKGKVRNVYMVYTILHSPVRQSVEVSRILPVERKAGSDRGETLYEPSYGRVYNYILPKYLNAFVYDAVLNSTASEYAMRMNSMDSATKNASDILAKLRIMYNRARQGSITREINEIVSGTEALKE